MCKKNYLKKFSTEVSQYGEEYIVTYHHNNNMGECRYRKMDMSGTKKPIKQNVLLLIHCDMSKVIDDINIDKELKEEDFNKLSMEIREDSLEMVNLFLDQTPSPIL